MDAPLATEMPSAGEALVQQQHVVDDGGRVVVVVVPLVPPFSKFSILRHEPTEENNYKKQKKQMRDSGPKQMQQRSKRKKEGVQQKPKIQQKGTQKRRPSKRKKDETCNKLTDTRESKHPNGDEFNRANSAAELTSVVHYNDIICFDNHLVIYSSTGTPRKNVETWQELADTKNKTILGKKDVVLSNLYFLGLRS